MMKLENISLMKGYSNKYVTVLKLIILLLFDISKLMKKMLSKLIKCLGSSLWETVENLQSIWRKPKVEKIVLIWIWKKFQILLFDLSSTIALIAQRF